MEQAITSNFGAIAIIWLLSTLISSAILGYVLGFPKLLKYQDAQLALLSAIARAKGVDEKLIDEIVEPFIKEADKPS
jgi:hypothetical protein